MRVRQAAPVLAEGERMLGKRGGRHAFSKKSSIVTRHGQYAKALIFEKF